jgi:hypothetical protein
MDQLAMLVVRVSDVADQQVAEAVRLEPVLGILFDPRRTNNATNMWRH